MAYPQEPAWWILFRNLPQHADRMAIRFLDHDTGAERQTLTYAELADLARRVAAGLRRAGIAPGERVAFFLPNSPEIVACYHGIWLAGAVGVPCNPSLKGSELEYQLTDSGACLLFTSPALLPVAREVAEHHGIRLVVVAAAGGDLSSAPANLHTWPEFLGDTADGGPAPVNPEHLALLLYTGGTTGLSKGAMLTHRNLVANTIQFATWYQFQEGNEVCIAAIPVCHSGGMSGVMNVPLYSGATLLLYQRFQAATVLPLIARYRVTRFFGVPTMYIAVLNLPDAGRHDLSSLRACRTNAAPLPAAVKTAFDALVGREVLVEGYGLTETSPLTHANPVHRAKAGSIGVPLPDTDACILDLQTGEPVAPGGEGELCLRGPQVMPGYWQKRKETEEAFAGGWFHTGDIARMDDEGYFYIIDRKKDVIISSGFKIWPREVEEVLYAHPAVQLAAVVGVPDDYRGEAVKAFVVPRDEHAATLNAETLIAHCRKNLAGYKVPRYMEFCSELPISGAGKMLRRVLRQRGGR